MIDPKLKEDIVQAFHAMLNVFDIDKSAELAGVGKMPLAHYLFLRRMYDLDIDKMNDCQLAMVCGMFDITFSAGDYGYSKDQNLAINNLGDLIFDLSH